MIGLLAIDEIREDYNKSPRGWHYLLGTDKKNKFLEILPKNEYMWIISRNFYNAPFSKAVYNKFKLKYPLRSTMEVKEFGVRYLDSKIDELGNESIEKILKETEPEKFSGFKDKDIFLGPIYSPFLKSEGYHPRTFEMFGNKVHIIYERMFLVLDVSACTETFKDMSAVLDHEMDNSTGAPVFG